MSEKTKNVGKGILWTLGGILTAVLGTVAGWIVYSKKFINHQLGLGRSVEAERNNFQSEDAGRLSYYFNGEGKGVPLVLLHSINAAASAYEMKPLFDRISGERLVYALDLPGFGFSERSDRLYSPQLYQEAIFEFLAEVVGEPADVVALSLTSEFAALTAVHHSEWVRSLALISPTGFKQPPTDKITKRAERRGAQNTLYAGLAVPLWNRPLFDLITSRKSIQYFLNQSFEGLVPASFVDYAYQSAHQPGAQYAPTYFLSGKLFTPAIRTTVYKVVEQPTLVIFDHDPHTNFEMLPGFLNNSENWQSVRISPTKGLPHWEQPERTVQALVDFWGEL
ncbi:alpha/beta fold hydrolase [bacterium]|nr:alpha/beta fold hydrolase [bacterium]